MVAAAVIGGVATLGGAAVSASAASSAAKTAKKTAATNNALQSQIYNQNAAALAPYEDTGAKANNAVENLLGLGGSSSGPVPASFAVGGVGYWPGGNGGYTTTQPQATNTSAADAQQDAFNAFKASDGYQFRLDQGQRSVQAALAGKGYLDSGAGQKALLNYGQGAASAEFGNYLGALTGQQGVGLTAASAQAGVGQNYANAVSANNNSAASASANAALTGASQINSALGSGLTALTLSRGLSSSYGGGGGGFGPGFLDD